MAWIGQWGSEKLRKPKEIGKITGKVANDSFQRADYDSGRISPIRQAIASEKNDLSLPSSPHNPPKKKVRHNIPGLRNQPKQDQTPSAVFDDDSGDPLMPGIHFHSMKVDWENDDESDIESELDLDDFDNEEFGINPLEMAEREDSKDLDWLPPRLRRVSTKQRYASRPFLASSIAFLLLLPTSSLANGAFRHAQRQQVPNVRESIRREDRQGWRVPWIILHSGRPFRSFLCPPSAKLIIFSARAHSIHRTFFFIDSARQRRYQHHPLQRHPCAHYHHLPPVLPLQLQQQRNSALPSHDVPLLGSTPPAHASCVVGTDKDNLVHLLVVPED
jgi:hypothetical protein